MKQLIILLLFVCKLAAQENREYLDENGKKISIEDFSKKYRTEKTTHGYSVSDSLISFKIVYRESEGKIDAEKLRLLNKLVELSNDRDFWIFVYYPGFDECNNGLAKIFQYRDDNKFQNKLKKIGKSQFIFIANGVDDIIKRKTPNIKWQIDSEDFFEKTFFEMHYPCYSFAIVRPDGNYIIHRAEFSRDMIIDAAKKIMRK